MNPQPYTTQQPRPNTYDRCVVGCDHGFHGLPCKVPGCLCETSVPHLVALEREAS